MKDLTKSKDLLSEPRVIAAYWGLMGESPIQPIQRCECGDCKLQMWPGDPDSEPRPIPGCIEKVAFEMRDACNDKDCPYVKMLDKVFAEALYHSPSYAWATAEEMVIASVLAWEAGQ